MVQLLERPGVHTDEVITSVSDAQRRRMLAGQSFDFVHSLGGSERLTLDRVREIARTMHDQGRDEQIFFTNGKDGKAGDRLDFLSTLRELGSQDAWIRLTRVDEVVPELAAVVAQFQKDLSSLYGFEVAPRVFKTFVTLFVSSPNAVTPYHIDHTWNFLLQVAGEKTVYLYDPNDPELAGQVVRERFYCNREQPKAPPEVDRGMPYKLTPGVGVHHPVNAPHWVQNGPECSISLSLGLCLHESNRAAKVHQVNSLLRRVGLKPLPPGQSPVRDSMKSTFIGLFADSRATSFDAVLYSGWQRLQRLSKGQLFSR